jgi:uncharacterized integral membrane protein
MAHGALTADAAVSMVSPHCDMNSKLLFKTIFLIILLLLLVLIGVHNKSTVSLTIPPILPGPIKQPAAIMYFAFFATGVLTGTVLTAGSGSSKGGGWGRSSKASK